MLGLPTVLPLRLLTALLLSLVTVSLLGLQFNCKVYYFNAWFTDRLTAWFTVLL